MANILIGRPLPIVTVGGSIDDPENIMTNDPKEVATASSGGAETIDIDLGAEYSVGAVYVGGASMTQNWTLSGGPASGDYNTVVVGSGTAVVAPKRTAVAPRQYLASFTPQTLRYLRLAGFPTLNSTVGIVRALETFQPTWNKEYGAGRSLVDMSSVARNRAGGFGIDEGAIVPGYNWTLGDITDDEVEVLFDMLRKVGESRPIVVAEEPTVSTDLDARLHYGLFRRIEGYERRSLGVTRWSLRMEEWL